MPTADGGSLLKVLDFGLSSGPDGMRLAELAGTLAYMAPELLRGQPPSVASDLYAAGMVAYEVLGGRPFAKEAQTTRLLLQILRETLDLSVLPPALGAVIGRALSKDPKERQPDVGTLLRELCAAAGLAPPEEPPPVRESLLIAARFVGRQAELEVLARALLDTQAGHGALWLLGGESGVGKSRLLEELRSQALLAGVLVLRGQAISDGGTSYQLWREVMRELVLHIELRAQEAGLLEALLPELAALIEQPVAPLPPELDPQARRLQRLRSLQDLLLRVPRPVLVLLEDLHWVDAESLALLVEVSAALADRPLLIVATYRNDEAPQLPSVLPAGRPMQLRRLLRHELAQLCESMLGPSGRAPELLDRIEEETEGNTYFIVEVIRALAEEAGSLDEIGRRSLPPRLFAGGVEQVLGRRLQRLSPAARELLQLAAVMGRHLELDVLATLCRESEALIQQSTEAGVLEVNEQRWRFSHDKLRERLLAELDPSEQRALHARIAAAIEEAYRGRELPAAQLARHYHQAQHLERAADCYAQAGEAALSRGAPAEAVLALEQAVALHQVVAVPHRVQVRVWRCLAQARYGLGELGSTDQALRRVCALVGWPLPSGIADLGAALLRQGVRQVQRLRRGPHKAPATPQQELAQALDRELLLALTVEEIYVWRCQPGLTLLCALRGSELAEALDAPPQRAYFRAAIAFLLSFTRLGGVGMRYMERTPSAAGTTGEIDSLRTQTMVALHKGDLAVAVERAARAVERSRAQRDDFALMYSLLQQQFVTCELDDFTRVLGISGELEELARRAKNPRYIAIARLGQLGALARFGRLTELEALFARTQTDASEVGAVADAVLYGLAALAAMRRGDRPCAHERAERALAAVARARWPLLQLRYALIGILEVYLDEGEPAASRAPIEHGLRVLRFGALQFSRMRPASALYHGLYALRRGALRSARRMLQRSLHAATQEGMRFEQAQAHYHLAQLLLRTAGAARPGGEAIAHLRAALALYEALGAAWDAERARRSLSRLAPP